MEKWIIVIAPNPLNIIVYAITFFVEKRIETLSMRDEAFLYERWGEKGERLELIYTNQSTSDSYGQFSHLILLPVPDLPF